MSRGNNVRGPTSALTEFLRESGITPTTIARRARTRVSQLQQEAGPSNTVPEQGENADTPALETREEGAAYDSDNLDEEDSSEPAAKKRKVSKASESKNKKGKGKAKKGKKGDDDADYQDSGEDAYTALSKMWKGDLPKPPVGSFEKCIKCQKQFTVTQYTLAADPPPGWLCHMCAKASGNDPFKKPAAPRKRKAPADKRVVVNFEERKFPSLASVCIELISKHIDDIEALGDVGGINMDAIAKAISRNRSLTPHNAPLFYDSEQTHLTLYDVTNLTPPALCTLAAFNRNLTHLRLDLCGRIDDTVIDVWSTGFPSLVRVELLGPFLVRAAGWKKFFKAHTTLEGFLITQSPRFDLECMQVLVESCSGLKELRLKEIGKITDAFLELLKPLAGTLVSLDLSYPSDPEALSERALIDLMRAVGASLTHLDLSGNVDIGDAFLFQGLKPHARRLTSLTLARTPDLTDAGVVEFFDTWPAAAEKDGEAPNPPLSVIDLSRNHRLTGDALLALLKHSGLSLTDLNINGWKETSQEALVQIAEYAQDLQKLDAGWCREVDDWVIKDLLQKCDRLEEINIWGCQRLTQSCTRKRGVNIYGLELHNVF